MPLLGGGFFSGRAIYDINAFQGTIDDVSDLISMISPYETPLLAALGDPQYPAMNVYHEWLEDSLGPNTLVSSTNIASDAGTSYAIGVVGGLNVTRQLQVGMILRGPEPSAEYMQVVGVTANTITVARAFAGTSATSLGAGATLSIVSDATLDGQDVTGDLSKSRVRLGNYTQIFKKDVIISGTMRAVAQHGVSDEWDYQIQLRTRETLRDLEKALILSRTSGNTLGSSSAYRTMDGLLARITTNVHSWGTLTDSALTSSFRAAWEQGASDIDLIVAGDAVKRAIDQFNSTRVQVLQGGGDTIFRNVVSVFECTYGMAPVLLSRWMPPNRYALISTARVKVIPLRGRNFHFEEVARTGDSTKGMIIGEYTVEIRNQEGMVQGRVG